MRVLYIYNFIFKLRLMDSIHILSNKMDVPNRYRLLHVLTLFFAELKIIVYVRFSFPVIETYLVCVAGWLRCVMALLELFWHTLMFLQAYTLNLVSCGYIYIYGLARRLLLIWYPLCSRSHLFIKSYTDKLDQISIYISI